MESQKIDGIGFVAGRWPMNPELDTIIFIHGSGSDSSLWHAQVTLLSDDINTIAIDLPGHGKSGGAGMTQVKDYANSVSKFIGSIGAKKPVICGLSIGGAIVLQLLIDEPENFKAGIAVNTGARLKVLPLIFEMIQKDYQGYVNGMQMLGASPKTDPSKIKPILAGMALCPPEVALGDFSACNAFDVMGQLGEIKAPVLVMTASDDQLTPIKYGQYLASHIKISAIVNIEDAGHMSPLEKPEEVAHAIRDFIKPL